MMILMFCYFSQVLQVLPSSADMQIIFVSCMHNEHVDFFPNPVFVHRHHQTHITFIIAIISTAINCILIIIIISDIIIITIATVRMGTIIAIVVR